MDAAMRPEAMPDGVDMNADMSAKAVVADDAGLHGGKSEGPGALWEPLAEGPLEGLGANGGHSSGAGGGAGEHQEHQEHQELPVGGEALRISLPEVQERPVVVEAPRVSLLEALFAAGAHARHK